MSEAVVSSEDAWRKERRLWRLVAGVFLLSLTANQLLDQHRATSANRRADEADRTTDELRAELARVRSELSEVRFQMLQVESKTVGLPEAVRAGEGRVGQLDQRVRQLEAGRKKDDGPDKP